jgi:hypothetical protein
MVENVFQDLIEDEETSGNSKKMFDEMIANLVREIRNIDVKKQITSAYLHLAKREAQKKEENGLENDWFESKLMFEKE